MKNILNTKVGADLEPKTNFAEQRVIRITEAGSHVLTMADIGSEIFITVAGVTVSMPTILDRVSKGVTQVGNATGGRFTFRIENDLVGDFLLYSNGDDGIAGVFSNGSVSIGTKGVNVGIAALAKAGDFIEVMITDAENFSGEKVWMIAGASGGAWKEAAVVV